MNKDIKYIFLFILCIFCSLSCDKDEGFIDVDQHNIAQDSYPFKRGSIIAEDTAEFNFLRELFGYHTTTIVAEIEEKRDGRIKINGFASSESTISITFDWGDGSITEGWFPQEHLYTDITKNYFITVTANYSPTLKEQARVLVRFKPPEISKVPIPSEIAVSIPDHHITFGTRLYQLSGDLGFFKDGFFDKYIPREDLEYIMSVAAWMQYEFVNKDVHLIDGVFNQVVLKNPNGGLGSLWFTNPPSFICDDFGLPGRIEYCALFHELGNGFTLNSPADFYYGGRIDGPANCMYSETMAVIFSLASTWELLNNYELYGLPDDIVFEIYQNARRDFRDIRETYDEYIDTGKGFESWNDWQTENDDTFNTFLTIAFLFCANAEQIGLGYKLPAQRMMELLQVFNQDLADRYDQHNDTPQAEEFRSTLMVTALSYAFNKDLREECRSLNFPVDDHTYEELMGMVE
jgi:hypothetical protein